MCDGMWGTLFQTSCFVPQFLCNAIGALIQVFPIWFVFSHITCILDACLGLELRPWGQPQVHRLQAHPHADPQVMRPPGLEHQFFWCTCCPSPVFFWVVLLSDLWNHSSKTFPTQIASFDYRHRAAPSAPVCLPRQCNRQHHQEIDQIPVFLPFSPLCRNVFFLLPNHLTFSMRFESSRQKPDPPEFIPFSPKKAPQKKRGGAGADEVESGCGIIGHCTPCSCSQYFWVFFLAPDITYNPKQTTCFIYRSGLQKFVTHHKRAATSFCRNWLCFSTYQFFSVLISGFIRCIFFFIKSWIVETNICSIFCLLFRFECAQIRSNVHFVKMQLKCTSHIKSAGWQKTIRQDPLFFSHFHKLACFHISHNGRFIPCAGWCRTSSWSSRATPRTRSRARAKGPLVSDPRDADSFIVRWAHKFFMKLFDLSLWIITF